MANAAFFRTEALRFLRWADTASDRAVARRWRQLADDYVTLADQLEARETGRPPLLRPLQRQPQQQQQAKLGTDDPSKW